jgi:hypothetical protein
MGLMAVSSLAHTIMPDSAEPTTTFVGAFRRSTGRSSIPVLAGGFGKHAVHRPGRRFHAPPTGDRCCRGSPSRYPLPGGVWSPWRHRPAERCDHAAGDPAASPISPWCASIRRFQVVRWNVVRWHHGAFAACVALVLLGRADVTQADPGGPTRSVLGGDGQDVAGGVLEPGDRRATAVDALRPARPSYCSKRTPRLVSSSRSIDVLTGS